MISGPESGCGFDLDAAAAAAALILVLELGPVVFWAGAGLTATDGWRALRPFTAFAAALTPDLDLELLLLLTLLWSAAEFKFELLPTPRPLLLTTRGPLNLKSASSDSPFTEGQRDGFRPQAGVAAAALDFKLKFPEELLLLVPFELNLF